jgi:hypothetical protein
MSKQTENEAIKSLVKIKTNPRQIKIFFQDKLENPPEFFNQISNDIATIDVICPDQACAELLNNFLNDTK